VTAGNVPGNDPVAARDVEVVGEFDLHRRRRLRRDQCAAAERQAADRRRAPGRQHGDAVADGDASGFDPPGVAAEIVPFVGTAIGARPNDALDRESERCVRPVARSRRQRLEQREQRGAAMPPHRVGGVVGLALHDVGTGQRRQRYDVRSTRAVVRRDVCGERLQFRGKRRIARLVVADQIHLVHGEDQRLDTDQRGQRRVPPRLGSHAFARIDQNHRSVGGAGRGNHVARVLLVTG
jgi:hypothetical protein